MKKLNTDHLIAIDQRNEIEHRLQYVKGGHSSHLIETLHDLGQKCHDGLRVADVSIRSDFCDFGKGVHSQLFFSKFLTRRQLLYDLEDLWPSVAR